MVNDNHGIGSKAMQNVNHFREQVARKQYHLLNPHDGVVSHRFECCRCNRDMPENCYFPLLKAERLDGLGSRARMQGLIVLNGVCLPCRKQQKGRWTKHRLYSPGLDRHFSSYIRILRAGASSRKLFFGLDKDDLLGLYLDQEGLCNLTGLPMAWHLRGKKGKGNRALSAPSVDRIDSAKDYTLDNVQMVLQVVNTMKGNMPQAVFIEACQAIAGHNLTA